MSDSNSSSPDFLGKMIDASPVSFERYLMAAMLHSHKTYIFLRKYLGRWDKKSDSKISFVTSHYNVLYEAIGTYWELFPAGVISPNPLPAFHVKAILIDWNNTARVATAVIELIIQELDEDLYKMELSTEFIETAILGTGFEHWQSTRLFKQALHTVEQQSKKTVLSIDDFIRTADTFRAQRATNKSRAIVGASLVRSSYAVAPKLKTSLTGLDAAIGGGFGMGETSIVAGISGGGKTVLACQLSLDFAKQGRRVVYVTTEIQPRALVARMASNYLQVDYGEFSNPADLDVTLKPGERAAKKEIQVIPPRLWKDANYVEKLRLFEIEVLSNIVFVDWSDAAGQSAAQHLVGELDRIEDNGFAPEVMLFDWIGGGLDRSTTDLDLREMYKNTADFMINVAKARSIAGVLFAQLDKTKATNKPCPGMSLVAECKSMADNAWNFIGISSLTEKNAQNGGAFAVRQNLYVEKARDGAAGVVPVERHFRFQRFVSLTVSNHVTGGSSNDNTQI